MEARKKTFSYQGNSYEIEFPNVGQYLDIEGEKTRLSKGNFGALVNSGTMSSLRAIQIITCSATLGVLCPKLFQDMKVKNFFELDAKDYMSLVKLYEEEISPWYAAWFKEFTKVLEISKEEETSNKEE